VYSLVNESNIRNLTKELLDYLVLSDAEFKPDLTAKICTLIQRFAPDKRWHIDNLIAVMTQAGPYVKEEVCRALVVLVSNAAELHAYAARRMFAAAREKLDSAAPSLLTTALWTVGEYGEMLLPGGWPVERVPWWLAAPGGWLLLVACCCCECECECECEVTQPAGFALHPFEPLYLSGTKGVLAGGG
jgi:hypothetical protein